MTPNTLSAWLERLESQHPVEIELGLDRVAAVAANLDLLEPNASVVTFAGTNGKGSCIATVEHMLLQAGRSVGVYTSPHLIRFNERVRICGRDVSDEDLCRAFEQIEAARGNISLSYFEVATLAALYLFAATELDVLLLEVGLGGRLDAINIVDPKIAVVTSISIDHVDWLGDTREKIGAEKAGIFRANIPMVCADPDPPRSVVDRAAELQMDCYFIGQGFSWSDEGTSWCWNGTDQAGKPAQLRAISKPGLHPDSVSAGLQVLLLLGLDSDPSMWAANVPHLNLMGRNQTYNIDGVEIICDVAHNPSAVDYLFRRLSPLGPEQSTLAVFAAMSDKDIHGMIAPAAGRVDGWYLCGLPQSSRAASEAALCQTFGELGIEPMAYCSDVASGFDSARSQLNAGDRLLVFGSFLTVAAAVQALSGELEKI